jgi:hypothetical protein
LVLGLDSTKPTALGKNVNAGTTEVACALVVFGIGSRALRDEEGGMGIGTLMSKETMLLVGVCAGCWRAQEWDGGWVDAGARTKAGT